MDEASVVMSYFDEHRGHARFVAKWTGEYPPLPDLPSGWKWLHGRDGSGPWYRWIRSVGFFEDGSVDVSLAGEVYAEAVNISTIETRSLEAVALADKIESENA